MTDCQNQNHYNDDPIDVDDDPMMLETEEILMGSNSLLEKLSSSSFRSATCVRRSRLSCDENGVNEDNSNDHDAAAADDDDGDDDDDEQGNTAMTTENSSSCGHQPDNNNSLDIQKQQQFGNNHHRHHRQQSTKDWENSWSSFDSTSANRNNMFEPLPVQDGISMELTTAATGRNVKGRQNNYDDNEKGMDMFWTRNTTTTTMNYSDNNNHKSMDGYYDNNKQQKYPQQQQEAEAEDEDDIFEPLPLHEESNTCDHMNANHHHYHRSNKSVSQNKNRDYQNYNQSEENQQVDKAYFNVVWTRNNNNNNNNNPNLYTSVNNTNYNNNYHNQRSFDDTYTISNNGVPLGEGGYGIVYSCAPRNNKRGRRAVKIVSTERYNRNEIDILQHLRGCPYIVTLHDIFYGFDRVYLVMEEMKGDLLTKLNEKLYYDEQEARTLVHTLLLALQFLHHRGVAHRDLKPENILMAGLTGDDDCVSIKLADFGLAKRFRDDHGRRVLEPNMYTLCGSPYYSAPEIFGRYPDHVDTVPYDERCDIWSVGIITYLLLAGYMPFIKAADVYDVVKQVNRGKFEFHEQYWAKISPAAKQFISSLLKVHPVQRCSIQEALDSSWISPTPNTGSTSNNVL